MLWKSDILTQKHIHFGFLMNRNVLAFDADSWHIFRQKEKISNHTLIDIIHSLLMNNLDQNVSRFSQILTQCLQEFLLILFHMNKWTVLL